MKKLLRVIDKQTQVFIRDDFEFNEKTEIGLDVKPAQGFVWAKWNGSRWIETEEHERPKFDYTYFAKTTTQQSTEQVAVEQPVVEEPVVEEPFTPMTQEEIDAKLDTHQENVANALEEDK